MQISATERRTRHEKIKYEIRRRGLSFAKLSEHEGLHRSVFAAVSAATKRSRRAARLIADVLDTTPEELWPEIYGDQND
ncbi:transcriptional regulator [Paracoccus sp. (in: a-proteobacteria)]|uniref:helix-turn-helix domain-containing protein n=1 Tax=Paracoccus sp. TaxID=267 RepID=UPI00391A52D3